VDPSARRAAVVIRARDEAASIGRLLDLLAAQTHPHEVLVVDSGSTDQTPEIARAHGARVLEIPSAEFTFGGALNTGTERTGGEVVVSLSAHAFPRSADWLSKVVRWFEDPDVACVFGEEHDTDGKRLRGVVRQDLALLLAQPAWGYSNGAGAFRRSLWEQQRFDEALPGTEDRAWSRWALELGHVCVLDPALAVDHDHTRDSLRQCFRRYEREARGFAAAFPELGPYSAEDAVSEWWSDRGWYRTRWRARMDPRRVARLSGKWKGRRG
jgi:rhamnosyltransferase